MGILQAAYQTYENHLDRVGVAEEGKEALAPVFHMLANANIEITLREDGVFQSACTIAKADAKTIIPVTLNSANRTGDNVTAHPLSDQLRYLAPFGKAKFEAYQNNLQKWAESQPAHPKLLAILKYIKEENIVGDLSSAKVIELDEMGQVKKGAIEGTSYDKCLIRWRVIPSPNGVKSACWEDRTLFDHFISYYQGSLEGSKCDICQLTGQEDIICDKHPKGVVYANYGAKLLSANDKTNFTYRGRFTKPEQALNIGYTASQKSHHALHWVAANTGITIGGRTFLCWNPEGKQVAINDFMNLPSEGANDFISYKKELLQIIGGYRNAFEDIDDVMIATLDAATTGRLSVTYYNELKASDFFGRIEQWYISCCWKTDFYGIQSPPLKQIVYCAFGTLRKEKIETDDKVMRDGMQILLHCMVNKQPIPMSFVQALKTKAGNLQIYPSALRDRILTTACAVIRKYRNDRSKKEEWTLALDVQNQDRSYLFGRLLAVAEQVERSTYDKDEKRETNALRMQMLFSQRPLYAWRIIEEKLIPYYQHLKPGLRHYYRGIVAEIFELLPDISDPSLGRRLADTYLMGYYQQRSALFSKKEKNNITEEKQDEYTEEQD